MPKEQLVTKKYLDKKLDERLGEQSRIIISAVDEILTKRLRETEERMSKKIDSVQSLIDAYVEEMRQIKSAIKKKLGIQIRAI